MGCQCTAGGFAVIPDQVRQTIRNFQRFLFVVHHFWALHGTVDQDGEVDRENFVLILLDLCCFDFFNTSGENDIFFLRK